MSGCTYPNCTCSSEVCTVTHSTYERGRRYDHPDQTTQYILDTLRAILDDLRDLRIALGDWRP